MGFGHLQVQALVCQVTAVKAQTQIWIKTCCRMWGQMGYQGSRVRSSSSRCCSQGSWVGWGGKSLLCGALWFCQGRHRSC
jgi:hypothetical protein